MDIDLVSLLLLAMRTLPLVLKHSKQQQLMSTGILLLDIEHLRHLMIMVVDITLLLVGVLLKMPQQVEATMPLDIMH